MCTILSLSPYFQMSSEFDKVNKVVVFLTIMSDCLGAHFPLINQNLAYRRVPFWDEKTSGTTRHALLALSHVPHPLLFFSVHNCLNGNCFATHNKENLKHCSREIPIMSNLITKQYLYYLISGSILLIL